MKPILENLINNKFYKTKEEIFQKLNLFFAYNQLTEEEYKNLMELTNKMYPDENKPVAEETVK